MGYPPARRLVIVGAGGHGRETAMVVRAINEVRPTWDLLGFADDGAAATNPTPAVLDALALLVPFGVALVGSVASLAECSAEYVTAIGSPTIRQRIDAQVSESIRAATLLHPQAVTGTGAFLGEGVIVACRSFVGARASVGRHSHLNLAVVVGAGCAVGDYVSLSPGAILEADVVIGNGVMVGTGAVVRTGVRVGDGAVIGAGAVVGHDVETGEVRVGRF